MTLKVNVHEAKTHFSRFLDRVGDGEEIIIAKAGKPMARLIPIARPSRLRVAGSARAKIRISRDFDAPLPEKLLSGFER
jgi:prevent-host-death family protein